ncbi:MAG TPA: response regulator [Ktedonobacterales bacterium]|jgi:DNA-binding response OmpR family regulator
MQKRKRGSKDDGEQTSNGKRVLVINDTPEILAAFKDILEDVGYIPLLYSYAITNIDEVEQLRPDLIILDYIFGGAKAGWQTLQLLKMRRSTATIPVIVCTAATHAVRDIEGYLTAHDIQLVPKPFDIDDLLGAMERALVNADASAKLVIEREKDEQEDP